VNIWVIIVAAVTIVAAAGKILLITWEEWEEKTFTEIKLKI